VEGKPLAGGRSGKGEKKKNGHQHGTKITTNRLGFGDAFQEISSKQRRRFKGQGKKKDNPRTRSGFLQKRTSSAAGKRPAQKRVVRTEVTPSQGPGRKEGEGHGVGISPGSVSYTEWLMERGRPKARFGEVLAKREINGEERGRAWPCRALYGQQG